MNDKKQALYEEFEFFKLMFKWSQNLCMLSAGILVALVIFIDRLSRFADMKFALTLSFISFAVCVVGSFGLLTHNCVAYLHKESNVALGVISFFRTSFGFLIGVVCITTFGVANLV